MTKRLATYSSRLAIYLLTALALVACGGGGGGGGGGFIDGGAGGNTDTYFLKLTLLNDSGSSTNQVTTAEPATLRVKVTKNKASGGPIEGAVVAASGNLDFLINGASEASGISDVDGLAEFRIEAGLEKGAGTINVSTTDANGNDVTASISFQVGADGLQLGYMQDGTFIPGEIKITPEGTLSSEGQAVLNVAIVDADGNLAESTERVRFESSCISSGKATLSPENPVQTSSGSASITYAPQGCTGSDVISAILVGGGASASSTLEVAKPSANGLTFVSAEPQYIVLRGTGGGPDRVEKSAVTFKTVNGNGEPQEGVEVAFSLTTDVGGLSLTPVNAVSDADGNVTTFVSAGDVATVVRVLATADAGDASGEVSAVSDVLTVSTGLPDQNSISLGVEDSFVAATAGNINGITRTIVVHMADKFNNPVPDGTAAIFTTEYGSIDPSCETGRRNGDRASGTPQTGECSVLWVSQSPRVPTLTGDALLKEITDPNYSCPGFATSGGPCPVELAQPGLQGYRSTILVTAIGEESFVDRNGNGIFDRAEADAGLFDNLTEAFIDQNDNGVLDPFSNACANNPSLMDCQTGQEETFSDFNNDGIFDTNGPSTIYPDQGEVAVYNGLLCPKAGDMQFVDGVPMNPDGWCSRELVNVRASTAVMLGQINYAISLFSGNSRTFSANSGNSYVAYIADRYNNPPPAGATISVEATGDCSIDGTVGGETVSAIYYSVAHGASFTVSGEGTEAGTVTVSVDSEGNTSSASFSCTPATPPDPNSGGLVLGP